MSVTWGAPAESIPSVSQENAGMAANTELRPVPERPARVAQIEPRADLLQSQEVSSNNIQQAATKTHAEVLFDLNQAFPKVSSLDLASTWEAIFNRLKA